MPILSHLLSALLSFFLSLFVFAPQPSSRPWRPLPNPNPPSRKRPSTPSSTRRAIQSVPRQPVLESHSDMMKTTTRMLLPPRLACRHRAPRACPVRHLRLLRLRSHSLTIHCRTHPSARRCSRHRLDRRAAIGALVTARRRPRLRPHRARARFRPARHRRDRRTATRRPRFS